MVFEVIDFLQKRTKTSHILKKPNSFVRFLEEINDSKNHFEITWPLRIFWTRKFKKYSSEKVFKKSLVKWKMEPSSLTKNMVTEHWVSRVLKYPKKCLGDLTTFPCLLDEGIRKIWKKLNSHGGFLRAD